MIEREQITGLVLAGGRASRMGGADKGLQDHLGTPLAAHALRRLAPQVGPLLVSANRNPAAYAAFGAPVVADRWPDHPGPLAGILAGLDACSTPYLATVPCDAPLFPEDLVARLAEALEREAAQIAIAAAPAEGGELRAQPVFCLMRIEVRDRLLQFLSGGGRKVGAWAATLAAVQVPFADDRAFTNANTLAELAELGRG